MSIHADQSADQRLLDAVLAYVAAHPDSTYDRFRDAVADWGTDWQGIEPRHMPASDMLVKPMDLALPKTPQLRLIDQFVSERETRYWEQSYTAADNLVGADMLAGYGFTEIIGKRGPFVSERVRAGIGVFGPGVNYPPHRHQAEEIYDLLAGSATFRIGDGPPVKKSACDVVHITPQLMHGFTMGDEPLVVFYLWQGGDLREKSTFPGAAA